MWIIKKVNGNMLKRLGCPLSSTSRAGPALCSLYSGRLKCGDELNRILEEYDFKTKILMGSLECVYAF